MKRKVVSGIGGCLLVVFLLLVCPIRGRAAENVTLQDNDNGVTVQYTLAPIESADENAKKAYRATISFVGEDAEPTELNIKSEVSAEDGTSYTITEIENIAYKSSIKMITMAEGITAVYNLTNYNETGSSLESVKFPSTVEDVKDGLIKWKEKQNSVIVPNWLNKMEPENGVVYAGKVAVYVPQAESGAAKTEEITFKDGCVKIAHKAMFGNTDVKKVNIPASVKAISGAAFDGCSNLSEVNFAENAQLEDLDWRVFYDCTALKSIKIPDSVTRIGTETFSGCTRLGTIDISKQSKLTQIEYGAFGYYPHNRIDLSSLWENKNNQYLSSYGQRENAGVPVTSIYLPASAIRPYSSSMYAAGLFAGCTTLTNVTIGDSGDKKAELPFEMFAECTNLKTVNLGGNVKKIETGAFIDCSSLQNIDLNGVEVIQSYSFARSGLTEVTIPESVNELQAIAFGGCTKLETMTIQGTIGKNSVKLLDILGNINYVSEKKYADYLSYVGLHTVDVQTYDPIRSNEDFRTLYPNQTALKTLHIEADDKGQTVLDAYERRGVAAHLPSLENVTLPEGMTSIPYQTFNQCFSLKSINIPTSIETIGAYAFFADIGIDVDFTKLTNLTSIGNYAFEVINANGGRIYNTPIAYEQRYTEKIDNGGIKNIILPDSVETIGDQAFFGQRNVKKLVIPESVKTVGSGAFKMLASLEELEIYAPLDLVDNSPWNEMFWSNTWRESENNKLKKITLGEKYSPETGNNGQIGYSLFYGQSLEEVDLQMNNIQNIGYNMFMNNKNLQSFTIPKTVKTIDRAAFYGTTSLKEMKIPENVKTMDVEAFRKSGLEKVYIFNKDLIIKEPTRENVSEEEEATKTEITLGGPDETVDDYIAIPKNVTIYGYAGSTAEAYAKKYDNKFVNLINKVTFDSMGGSAVEEQQVNYWETVTKPENPTREHYIFKGWYTDKSYQKAFDFNTEVESNMILYAKWEKEQPVIKKNTLVTSGKYTYKVTSTTANQTGTVEFTGNATGKKSATVTIPSTVTLNGKKFKVTSIAPKAFAKNKTVKKVVIGNNVKIIRTKAFYGMKNLQTVVIGKNVTTINSQAFGNLPKLKKVTVKSKKLKKVHKKAFKPVKHKFTIKVPKAKKAQYKKLMKTYKNLIR